MYRVGYYHQSMRIPCETIFKLSINQSSNLNKPSNRRSKHSNVVKLNKMNELLLKFNCNVRRVLMQQNDVI